MAGKNKTETTIKAVKTKAKLPLDMMVDCSNYTQGKLIYASKRQNGYIYEWASFGESQPLELQELIAMKNSYPSFFKENWIYIEDLEVLEYLGVSKFYEGIIDIEKFDDFFKLSPKVIKEKISSMSNGAKNNIALRAIQLIENGVLDSIKTITAIEEVLGYDLIEK